MPPCKVFTQTEQKQRKYVCVNMVMVKINLHRTTRIKIFTTRQRSCRKVMFSVVSICLSTGGGHYVIITNNAIDHLTIPGSPPSSPYRTPQPPLPPTMFKLIQLDLTIDGFHPPGHIQLGPYDTGTLPQTCSP